MAGTKKRLKNIEKTLARFAAGEKRIVDLIVGLVTEQVERRLGDRFDERLARLKDELARDLGRRFPEREDVQRLVEESVLRALQRHEEQSRGAEERMVEAVARAIEKRTAD
jgi:hypothetical protein